MTKVLSQQLVEQTATELAQFIRSGEVSAQEVVEAHIQRIEEANPHLNAVVYPLFEQARIAAKEADRQQASGKSLGSLHGVPVTIKDQFEVAGTPATWGLPGRAGKIATEDGPLVRRLRDAGAILLGKTNVSQLLLYNAADNPLYGRTNNPWDPERTPGGSSGGEAAIIAACGSPLGLGGDIGGSLRGPAHFCGIATLKPTSRRLTTLDNPDDFADAILCPASAFPALPHNVQDFALPGGVYGSLYNLLGMPAGVVPVTKVLPEEEHFPTSRSTKQVRALAAIATGSAGLPVGVQVVARHWREDVALAVMAAIERNV